jgi:hypothetical protein
MQQGTIRRCELCEAHAIIRKAAGLEPLAIPPHHRNEHYDL